jgi:hypothetical protein
MALSPLSVGRLVAIQDDAVLRDGLVGVARSTAVGIKLRGQSASWSRVYPFLQAFLELSA